MTGGPDSGEQRRLLQRGLQRDDLPLEQLWLRYFALGGSCGLVEVEAHLIGMMTLPSYEGDLLAHATNERLDEVDREARVPYSRTLRSDPARSDPGPALVTLLGRAQCATPDQLGELAEQAGRSMDMAVVAYLTDHDQAWLVPVPSSTSSGRQPLEIDATLAGRAYQSGASLAMDADGGGHLWVPLRDGVDRLGVLDVMVQDRTELADPGLREQSSWLASLLSSLISSLDATGDGLDAVRRRRPRTAAAELLWQLLPPASAGTDRFDLAAWVAPPDAAGGDAYDYSLGQDHATFAIYDAMGHGLGAGLIATAALAATRSARRNGADLPEQVRAADEVVAAHFGDSAFLTAFLGTLDLRTGLLRYVRAGHGAPLLLRDGRAVKTLADGGRLPLGLALADDTAPLGYESMQPGDWLVLHTDGVVEARDAEGTFFGEARLVDLLEREVASGLPPGETVRRLSQAVLRHQQGELQDDATIVLLRWDGPPA